MQRHHDEADRQLTTRLRASQSELLKRPCIRQTGPSTRLLAKKNEKMTSYPILAGWSLPAGASIPLIGVLNSGIARSVGNPFAATAIMFAVALLLAAAITLPLYGLPSAQSMTSAPSKTTAQASSSLSMLYLPQSSSLVSVLPVSLHSS